MRIQRAAAVVGLATFAFATACLEALPPKDKYAPRDVAAPDGASLAEACTPSGVEICFDTVDNNCNGVIDEGCGVHTGILQFAVSWDAAAADIDLEVVDTFGELATLGQPTRGGLLKERDCPSDSGRCLGQNLENVYLVGGEPEKGRYRAVVKLDKLNGAEAPVHVRFGVRIGSRSHALTFDLSPGEKTSEKVLEFTL